MRRVYKNPPIEEALVEVQFAQPSDWDLTIPGRLHEALKADYPGKLRQQKLITANVVLGSAEQLPTLSTIGGLGKVQFPTEDGRRLIAVGPNVMSIHVLRPYPGWEDFRSRIERGLRAYCGVVAPTAVARIGLRYINRISLPGPNVRLEEHFRCATPNIDGVPESTTGFAHRDELRYPDDVQLLLTYASLAAPDASASFLLDIDLVQTLDTPLSVDRVLVHIDNLRERERVAFEALITDKLRATFDA